jgi:hypothetical protein
MKNNKAEISTEENLLYEGEQRCICNRLVCVVKGNVVEIKCPKCKRMVRISTSGINRIECD